jgi:hypothetical protein
MRGALMLVLVACASSSQHASSPDASSNGGDSGVARDAASDAASFPDTLDGNRDRLLASYLAWLQAEPTVTQSNGLVGGQLHSVCDLWTKLDPSSQGVFRTITHRLWGSVLRVDNSRMLEHVTKLYRVIGGQSATASDPGSCGGGEYNRMIMHQDVVLHDAQLAANNNKGASPYDIADIPSTSSWRNSQDIGGPHAPFDLSDETSAGAPRGQTQYFRDPTSTAANAPLGRMDLTTLVDPYALEMDQDYDCTHNSNPDCSYTLYGPACFPESSQLGTQIYTQDYGDFEPAYKPAGC